LNQLKSGKQPMDLLAACGDLTCIVSDVVSMIIMPYFLQARLMFLNERRTAGSKNGNVIQ